jgi:23S rRNA pseudouridine1911/1915/1917 synthase
MNSAEEAKSQTIDSVKSEFAVSPDESGMRLDIFLAQKDSSLSRSQAQKAIDDGLVWVNQNNVKASHKLRTGEVVTIKKMEAAPCEVAAENIPLQVVYEDKSIIVIDKPAGMVVHPAAGNYQGTLVNALLHHCKDLSGIGGVLRPGIVHRLDKGTSGLILVAKSNAAHQGLSGQFQNHEIKKAYKALVLGNIQESQGVIDAPVGRHPVERKKMSTHSRRGKGAITRWQVNERFWIATLLDIDIETGRTHQIRVHLNSIGHPVVGDSVYGGTKKANAISDTALKAKLKGMNRQALHAARLRFTHPITGEPMDFSSLLPEDITNICEFLRAYRIEFDERNRP